MAQTGFHVYIGYNLKNTNYIFTENRHMGTYVIEQLGLLNK